MHRLGGDPARAAGFTLLEVLVAFVIMSLVLVPLIQGGSEGLGSVDAATRMEVAVALAQSRLSLFDASLSGALGAPAAEELQGDEGGYHWRLQVSPAASIPLGTTGQATTLYNVGVTMTWRAGPRSSSVRLETQRLTPPNAVQ